MSHPKELSQWCDRVTSHLSRLSLPQARTLALWSYAIVLCNCCGLSDVALFLATLLRQKENAVRERLRDLYRPAEKKRGTHRRELEVDRVTSDLLAWCAGEAKRLVVALDVTNLGDRFHVLAISVVCRGGAVPVAWRVLRGNEPGEWTPH